MNTSIKVKSTSKRKGIEEPLLNGQESDMQLGQRDIVGSMDPTSTQKNTLILDQSLDNSSLVNIAMGDSSVFSAANQPPVENQESFGAQSLNESLNNISISNPPESSNQSNVHTNLKSFFEKPPVVNVNTASYMRGNVEVLSSEDSRSVSPSIIQEPPKFRVPQSNQIPKQVINYKVVGGQSSQGPQRSHQQRPQADILQSDEEMKEHPKNTYDTKKRPRDLISDHRRESLQPIQEDFRESHQIRDHRPSPWASFGASRHQVDQKVEVSRSQLQSVIKSKLDVYNVLSKEGQYYLPPFNDCPMEFIKDFFNGKKKVFPMSEIRMIDVPHFDELTGRRIFDEIKQNAMYQEYLPDMRHLTKPLNRQYMFNVINTIDPEFFPENIRAGYEQRKNRHCDKNNSKITISSHLRDLLLSSNQIVHNRGRALAFLGNSSKKRKRDELGGAAIGGEDSFSDEDSHRRPVRKPKHEYQRKVDLKQPPRNPPQFGGSSSAHQSNNPFMPRPMHFTNSQANAPLRKGDQERRQYQESLFDVESDGSYQ